MSTHSIATTARTDLLRLALAADAAVTGANAVAYLAGAFVIDSLLGVPAEALLVLGAFLALYGALVLRLATRQAISRAGTVAVIGANVAWAAASLLVLGLDTFTPDAAGQVWIAVQAVAVAGFAALQWIGLRRA